MTSDARDSARAAGLLDVRDGGHDAVGEGPGLVLRALSRQVQQRQALLLTVSPRREGGVCAVDDELVIVTERRIRQVARASDFEDASLG